MKKTLLLFTALLMGLTTVSATTANDHDVGHHNKGDRFDRYSQPILFMERGIEFLVFPDGSFDFDTNNYDPYFDNNMYYRSNSRRSNINIAYRGPNMNIAYTNNRNNGVHISRDRFGQVRRVGNVFVNYNRIGQVTRIGSVYIEYGRGRHGLLRQVGGLRVNYNRWGEIVNIRGQVNRFHDGYCNICGTTSCDMIHNFGNNRDRHIHDDWYENNRDDNYYYYKRNGKVKKHKKNKKIRR